MRKRKKEIGTEGLFEALMTGNVSHLAFGQTPNHRSKKYREHMRNKCQKTYI
jgi:hypothetical protein